jgi:hypothetical protein
MRDEIADVRAGQAVGRKHVLADGPHVAHGVLEDLLAAHLDEKVVADHVAKAALACPIRRP